MGELLIKPLVENLVWLYVFISAPDLPASMLPLGMSASDNKTKLVQLDPGMTLKIFFQEILSLNHPSSLPLAWML